MHGYLFCTCKDLKKKKQEEPPLKFGIISLTNAAALLVFSL